MLKEITFYADFVKKRWCDNNKKTQNLRTFFFGTQKKKKTVIAYMRMCVMLEEITALGPVHRHRFLVPSQKS
jgi:hypothetical protein